MFKKRLVITLDDNNTARAREVPEWRFQLGLIKPRLMGLIRTWAKKRKRKILTPDDYW